jgi:hypothetical protein
VTESYNCKNVETTWNSDNTIAAKTPQTPNTFFIQTQRMTPYLRNENGIIKGRYRKQLLLAQVPPPLPLFPKSYDITCTYYIRR